MEDFSACIVSPDQEITIIKYFDILYYCVRKTEEYISVSKQNLEHFQSFREKYTHFDPYFDFVMLELKHILIGPFFQPDHYLLPYNGKYYIMLLNQVSMYYRDLTSQIPNFSFDFLPATDENICMNLPIQGDTRIGFYVDDEGNLYHNYLLERHLKMAYLLLHQQMIYRPDICRKYYHYMIKYGYYKKVDFLTEKLGYMLGFPSDQNQIIFNLKMLTEKQKNLLAIYRRNYRTKREEYGKNQFTLK